MSLKYGSSGHSSTPSAERVAIQLPEDGEQRPLISFCMLAYNQASVVREAVEGALTQTYSPLEIIFSDDCSPDNTFDVIRQVVSGYKGPHRIILNRNTRNLGVVPHVNKVFGELAHGDLIVAAAGDDVSLPERTEKLWLAWEGSGRRAKLISSGRLHIDSTGRTVGEWVPFKPGYENGSITDFVLNPHGSFTGATAMYHRDVLNVFGPLTVAHVEDGPLIIRGRLLGPVVALPDKLIKYRISADSLTGHLDPDYRRKMLLANTWRMSIYEQLVSDLNKIAILELFSAKELNALINMCHKHWRKHELTRSLAREALNVRLFAWLRLLFIVPLRQSLNNLVYLLPYSSYPMLMKYGLPTDSRLWARLGDYKRRVLSLLHKR